MQVSWDASEDDGDALLAGYDVFVDGKIERVVKPSVRKVDLDLNGGLHTVKIHVVAITKHPVGHSDPSNIASVTMSRSVNTTYPCCI